MKRRIIKADAHNWAIQEWQEGGGTVERGRYSGQEKQAKWKNPEAFFPTLHAACGSMLDEIVGDDWTGENVREAIDKAKAEIGEMIRSMVENTPTDTMIGLLQERGWIVTNGKKGRASYTDDTPESEE